MDAAGHITFTDRPDTTPSLGAVSVPALDVATTLASNSAITSRRTAMIDANEATRRLGEALLARQQGAERLPGERVRNSDASVADDRYWRRQEESRRAVEQAQRRSSEARRSLHARR